MVKTVLLLGDASHPEIQLLQHHLSSGGAKLLILDTAQFAKQFYLSWSVSRNSGVLHSSQGHYAFEDIDSAFWFRYSLSANEATTMQTQKDYQAMLGTLLACKSINWCNNVEAIRYHQQKPVQLAHASQLGLITPPTYIGNHVDQAWAFVQSHESLICKPVHGGRHTIQIRRNEVSVTDIKQMVSQSPLTFQRFIEGTNIRTYVIGDSVHSAEICSGATDFRTDSNARLLAHTLPDATAQQAIDVCRAFGMRWTAIDWRFTSEGEYVFLEANPAPCFAEFERQSGHPVSHLLAQMLLGPKPSKV